MIEAFNITKKYGEKVILTVNSLSLSGGELSALLGPNGSGKSTLLRCLSFIELPDSGSIKFNDLSYEYPFTDINLYKVWPDISLVFQQFFLWPHLSVRENLLLPLKKRFPENYPEELDKVVDLFDIDRLLSMYPTKISVGQKQTVALAKAISLKPKLLLLDEVTSALDNQNALKISQILKTVKDQGTAVLMVTHSINFAIRCADSYIVLENGEIVENQPISSILTPTSDFLSKSLTKNGYLI